MCVLKAIPYHDASEIIPHYNLPLTKSALALDGCCCLIPIGVVMRTFFNRGCNASFRMCLYSSSCLDNLLFILPALIVVRNSLCCVFSCSPSAVSACCVFCENYSLFSTVQKCSLKVPLERLELLIISIYSLV